MLQRPAIIAHFLQVREQARCKTAQE